MPERTINEIFTENLKQLTDGGNMTYTDLANLLGVSRSTVSMWITGKSLPRMEMLDSIANLFGTTVEELTKDHSKPETVEYIDLNGNRVTTTGYVRSLNDNDFLYLAAHADKYNFTEEELKEIRQFAEFVKSKRKN